jgi:hypothetical protein
MLILKQANKSRAIADRSADDYDVFSGVEHVGRIMLTPTASRETPWFWTITVRLPNTIQHRGYAASREAAMADFKAVWKRKP